MKISLENGVVRVDNVKFCLYEVANGESLPTGNFEVEARYAHHFGRVLPYVESIGWLGSDSSCTVILGKVKNRSDVIGDGCVVKRLVACIETADETGTAVTAEVA